MTPEHGELALKDRPEDIFDLTDRTVVVVGGGGKIAAHFSRTLVHAGANLILADKNSERCGQAALEVESKTGVKVENLSLDASDPKQVATLFESIYNHGHRLDVLVYSVMAKPAGYYRPTDRYNMTTWEETMKSNLTGAFLCCREAAKYMKIAKSGTIVVVSSIYGLVAPDQRVYENCTPSSNIYEDDESLTCPTIYSASKAGLIGLAKHMAAEFGRSNIRVNALIPGGVFDGQEEAFRKEYVHRTPLGRMATWSDFNGAMLFLVSDASRYMTGACLVVDGGWTAW